MLKLNKFVTPILAVAAICSSAGANAALIYYSNEAAFDLAAGPLGVQTFNNVSAGIETCGDVVDSSTNACGLTAGDILPGLSISAGNSPAIASIGAGSNGFTNGGLFANYYNETLNLNFAPGAGAIGVGLLSAFSTDNFTVSFYDSLNALIGSTVVNGVASSGTGTFFGVIGDAGESIARINFSSFSGQQAEGVDLVKFGPATEAPEPATLSLLGLGLAAIAAAKSRNKAC